MRKGFILFFLLAGFTQRVVAQSEFSFTGGEVANGNVRFIMTGGGIQIDRPLSEPPPMPLPLAPIIIETLTASVFSGMMDRPEEPEIPDAFKLGQNYPNPFNSSTTIPYSLSKDALVRLELYDVTGRLIATLVNQRQTAGQYNLRVDFNDKATGMYLVRMRTDGYIATSKLMHIK